MLREGPEKKENQRTTHLGLSLGIVVFLLSFIHLFLPMILLIRERLLADLFRCVRSCDFLQLFLCLGTESCIQKVLVRRWTLIPPISFKCHTSSWWMAEMKLNLHIAGLASGWCCWGCWCSDMSMNKDGRTRDSGGYRQRGTKHVRVSGGRPFIWLTSRAVISSTVDDHVPGNLVNFKLNDVRILISRTGLDNIEPKDRAALKQFNARYQRRSHCLPKGCLQHSALRASGWKWDAMRVSMSQTIGVLLFENAFDLIWSFNIWVTEGPLWRREATRSDSSSKNRMILLSWRLFRLDLKKFARSLQSVSNEWSAWALSKTTGFESSVGLQEGSGVSQATFISGTLTNRHHSWQQILSLEIKTKAPLAARILMMIIILPPATENAEKMRIFEMSSPCEHKYGRWMWCERWPIKPECLHNGYVRQEEKKTSRGQSID